MLENSHETTKMSQRLIITYIFNFVETSVLVPWWQINLQPLIGVISIIANATLIMQRSRCFAKLSITIFSSLTFSNRLPRPNISWVLKIHFFALDSKKKCITL